MNHVLADMLLLGSTISSSAQPVARRRYSAAGHRWTTRAQPLRVRGRAETSPHQTPSPRPPPLEEAVITAIVAAVLFAIALVLHLAGLSLGPLDATAFQLAGLLAVGLHLAGIGTSRRVYARRR